MGKTFGGIETHSATLASLLTERGHKVVLACSTDGTFALTDTMALPSYGIRIRNSGDLKAMTRFVRIIRKERIDVIIANGGREYWPCAVAAMLCGCRIVFVRHQTDRIRSTTRWLIEHRIDAVVAVSGAVRDALLRSGVPDEKVVLIQNGAPLGRFNPEAIDSAAVRREIGLQAGDTVVGSVGKLNYGKGVDELLQGFAALAQTYPSLKLLYVGEGEARERIEQNAAEQGLAGRVILAGFRADTERMYAAMDIAVLASTCDEAFGMVLIEAMAMGKPVIGTTVGGIPTIIQDGVTGLLVAPGSGDALAAGIKQYLDNPDLRDAIAREGQRMVKYSFSDSVMGDRFEALLQQVAARHNRHDK